MKRGIGTSKLPRHTQEHKKRGYNFRVANTKSQEHERGIKTLKLPKHIQKHKKKDWNLKVTEKKVQKHEERV